MQRRADMKWLTAVVLFSIIGLAGCGSSGNADAPTNPAPHEAKWVASHRSSIVIPESVKDEDGNLTPVITGKMIEEHVYQCQVCHGGDFKGAKAGAAGPDCLDCHVLDPVKYPVMCYSCHGYPVTTTYKWYSSNRSRRSAPPLDPAFSVKVMANPDDMSIHLRHKTVSIGTGNVDAEECAVCHGEKSARGVKHHEIVMMDPSKNLGCLGPLPAGCHTFGFANGSFGFITPPCTDCHSKLP